MKFVSRVLAVCALVALSACGSNAKPYDFEKAVEPMENSMRVLRSFLAPSAQLLQFEKTYMTKLLPPLLAIAAPEHLNEFLKLNNATIRFDEQLLELYNEMKLVKNQIDGMEDPKAQEPLREKMRNLVQAFNYVSGKRYYAVAEAGLATVEEVDKLKQNEHVQFLDKLVKSIIFSPFESYM